MEHEQVEQQVARRSALIYLPISAGTATLFLLAASLGGDYPPVAKLGGTVWVGLLSLIVSMPLVTARVKKQLLGQSPR
ncbi:MAG: hypothetical protein M1546_18575 [Chloroflexi bacterium]|nr:hypothetical protein [Chloroflexota bacterium]